MYDFFIYQVVFLFQQLQYDPKQPTLTPGITCDLYMDKIKRVFMQGVNALEAFRLTL